MNRVRKFKDHATAVSRIWNEIRDRQAPTEKAAGKRSKKAALTPVKDRIAESSGRSSRRHRSGGNRSRGDRSGGHGNHQQKGSDPGFAAGSEGATLSRMMAATGWQKHSVRGFLSGAVHKKMCLTVLSTKAKDGERVYRLKQ